MTSITTADIKNAITEFLKVQLATKLEVELKKLGKAKPGSPEEQAVKESITVLNERFLTDNWLKNAATKMANQLKFGTHISKGIHPDSRGDNINFRPVQNLPVGLVGSQQLTTAELDANGNAAALPLATFFNITIKQSRLRELILTDHPALNGAFTDAPDVSERYQQLFKQALTGDTSQPTSSARNKQILWPLAKAIEKDRYHGLIPLHPSALVYSVSQTINGLRFSEENKTARANRQKLNCEQQAYHSFVSLVTTNLGGTKPQNISLLTSKQRGRMLLLESLPPNYTRQLKYSLSKYENNFFNNKLAYHCTEGLQLLYSVVENPKNTTCLRQKRKQALGLIFGQVCQIATYLQQVYPPGWSKNHPIKQHQKYWLDPERAQQPDQDSFKTERHEKDWIKELMKDFSLWINDILRKEFKKQVTNFDDNTYQEWFREMESAIKASQRAGQDIFL